MIESTADETGVLRERLLSVVRGHRLRSLLLHGGRGALEGVALACVLLAGALVWARLGHTSGGLWLVALCGVAIALPLLVRLLTPVSVLQAALSIEHAFPFLQDRVATAVDLARRDQTPGGIARRVLSEADGALASLPLARALPMGVLRPGAALAGCGLAVLLAAWVLAPVRAETPSPQPPPPVAAVVAPAAPQPRLYDLSLTIEPPAYSGLPMRQLAPGPEIIRALIGSRVTVGVTSEPPSAQVSLELASAPAVAMAQVGEGRAAVSLTLTERIVCGIVGEFASGRISTPRFTVEPVADASPTVSLVRPERDLALDLAGDLEVAVAAADDFRVNAIGLRYRIEGESRWRSLQLDARPGASVSASARLNLSAIGLRRGKSLQLRGWATDNDAFGGPKTSVSRTVTIALREVAAPDPRITPVERAEDERQDVFERMQREAARFERELTAALGQMDAGDTPGSLAEMSARLQEAAERLQQQAGALETSMRELEQQLALDEFISPELVEKVRELHRLMSEALDEDLRRALDELQRALEQADPQQMRMSLEQARKAQRRFMDRLDQTLDLLRRARLEAELQRLRKLAEELADRQQDLRDAASEGAEADQRRLARDTEPLVERIAVAAEAAREVSPQLSRDLDALAGEMMRRDTPGEMRQAASALGRNRPAAAREPQQRALDALRMAASRLAEAEESLTADMRAEMTRAAAEMLRDTLHLSRGQEELAAETRRVSEGASRDLLRDKQRIGPVSRRQESLAESVERLGRRMDEMARSTPAMDPSFGREIAAVGHDMRQAAREIDGARLGLADAMQGELVARLNDAARRLLELGDQMSQMSAQSMLGEYMRQLEELANRQRGLNEQTGEAGDGQRQPGGRPGMGLPQLALEQAMIRAALERMVRGAQGAEMQAADQLGGVAGEMEKVEGDLRRGRIERETLERQGHILEKMLDAQRSLYTRDPERAERQAERPTAYQPPPPPPALSSSLLRSPKVRLSPPATGGRLPVGFEEMVEAYFQRLGGEARP
jgi:hypothetical protein